MNSCGPMVPAPDSLERYPGGADWPLQSYLLIPALPAAVTIGRHHAREHIAAWGLDADAAELVVSELVTNAVQFARMARRSAPFVRVWLSASHSGPLLIQVWDPCEAKPVLRTPRPEAIGGRGLLLVHALSTDWGTYTPAALCGKVVWAIVPAGSP
jgi:anti-sigma regulatory factor (Ser/Thr protein kinase)